MGGPPGPGEDTWRLVERVEGPPEVALLRRGRHHGIVVDGVFLMSTEHTGSERAMVRIAVAELGTGISVLVGGLGVGAGVDEAVRCGVRRVLVAETEPAVVRWWRAHLRPAGSGLPGAAEPEIVLADVHDVLLGSEPGSLDAVLLDTDNGPDWLARASNARLYSAEGLRLVASRLRPGGCAVYWSSAPSDAFAARLRAAFPVVRTVAIERPDLRAGVPGDVLYVARTAS